MAVVLLCSRMLLLLMSLLTNHFAGAFVKFARHHVIKVEKSCRFFGVKSIAVHRLSLSCSLRLSQPSVTSGSEYNNVSYQNTIRYHAQTISTTQQQQQFQLPSKIVGIIFDMDGTLLKPVIDFADMRRRIYQIASNDLGRLVHNGCVLELADRLSAEGQALACEVFNDIEQKAIRDMEFEDGLAELCQWLDDRNIRRAVLTRNVQRSVDAMHSKLFDHFGVPSFSPAVARDSRCPQGNLIPPKPHPDAIHHICEQWQCHVSQVVMVGDSVADDIVAATRAGCGASVLLAKQIDNSSGNDKDSNREEQIPTLTVASLTDLCKILIVGMKEV